MAAPILPVLSAHPDILQQLLDAEVEAAKNDPTLLPDLLAAIASNSYTSFALHHFGFVLRIGGIIGANPDLLAAAEKALR